MLADFLVVDVTKPYAEQGSFLEIELAACAGRSRTKPAGGRALNDDVMDTMFTLLINAGNGPTIRDGVDQSTPACDADLSLPRAAESRPAPAPRAPLTIEDTVNTTTAATGGLELDDIQGGALHERPSPYVGSYLLLRIDDSRRRPRTGPAAAAGGRPRATVGRSGARRLDHCRLHLSRARRRSACRSESLASFAPEFRQGMAARAAELGDVGESSPEHWETPLGTSRRARRAGGAVARRGAAARRSWSRRARPTRSCPGSS